MYNLDGTNTPKSPLSGNERLPGLDPDASGAARNIPVTISELKTFATETLQTSLTALSAQLTQVSNDLDTAEVDISGLDTDLTAAEAAITTLQAELVTANTSIATLEVSNQRTVVSLTADAANNTTTLQAAINQQASNGGGVVAVKDPGVYEFNRGTDAVATLVRCCISIPSNVIVEVGQGVTFRQADNQRAFLFHNSDPVLGNINVGIINNGTIDANSSTNLALVGTFPIYPAFTVRFDNANHILIKGSGIWIDQAKYQVHIQRAQFVIIESMRFNTNSDGVHLGGQVYDVVIGDLSGYCGDNMFAITTQDYVHYDRDHLGNRITGDSKRVKIRSLSGTDTVEMFRLVGDTGQTIEDVEVGSVTGTLRDDQTSAVGLINDSGVGAGEARITNIRIGTINVGKATSGRAASLNLNGGDIGYVQVDSIICGDNMGGVYCAGNIDAVKVNNIYNLYKSKNRLIRFTNGVTNEFYVGRIFSRVPVDTLGDVAAIAAEGGANQLTIGSLDLQGHSSEQAFMVTTGSESLNVSVVGKAIISGYTSAFRTYNSAIPVKISGGDWKISTVNFVAQGAVNAVLNSFDVESQTNGRLEGGTGQNTFLTTPPKLTTFQVLASDLSSTSAAQKYLLTTLPRGAVVHAVTMTHDKEFRGGNVSAVTAAVTTLAGNNDITTNFDVYQLPSFSVFHETDGLNYRKAKNANMGVYIRFQTTGDNVDQLTSGQLTIIITWSIKAVRS